MFKSVLVEANERTGFYKTKKCLEQEKKIANT